MGYRLLSVSDSILPQMNRTRTADVCTLPASRRDLSLCSSLGIVLRLWNYISCWPNLDDSPVLISQVHCLFRRPCKSCRSNAIVCHLCCDTFLATCAVQNGGCQQICQDSPTGPVCTCSDGFTLNPVDMRSCLGKYAAS